MNVACKRSGSLWPLNNGAQQEKRPTMRGRRDEPVMHRPRFRSFRCIRVIVKVSQSYGESSQICERVPLRSHTLVEIFIRNNLSAHRNARVSDSKAPVKRSERNLFPAIATRWNWHSRNALTVTLLDIFHESNFSPLSLDNREIPFWKEVWSFHMTSYLSHHDIIIILIDLSLRRENIRYWNL